MTVDAMATLPEPQRDQTRAALKAAFGRSAPRRGALVTGGASGAALLRVEVRRRGYLVRVEGPVTPLLRRNPHRHTCTTIAAEAGIAPRVHYLDEDAGVAVSDFVAVQPLSRFPGGASALARAVGELVGRLQRETAFPQLVYYPDLLTRTFELVRESGAFDQSLWEPHLERMLKVRSICDWDATPLVSSHNDLNRGNVLFDGERLWLIDWESGYRNSPFVDLSIILDNFASTRADEEGLLRAALRKPLTKILREQLSATRSLTRLYYACFLFHASGLAEAGSITDLTPPAASAVAAALTSGARTPGDPAVLRDLAKIMLAGFLSGEPVEGLTQAITVAIPGS